MEGKEGSLELLSASRGGQEAPCHPPVGSPLILIFDPGRLKDGTSQLSHPGSWGASEHSQHWLPECQKLLPAPEEPKLAAVRCSFLTPFQALQFYFPLEPAFDGSDKVFMTLLLHGTVVFT